MRRAIPFVLIAGTLLLSAAAEARKLTNPKLSAYANSRLRDSKGRFVRAKPFILEGRANPAMTGQSRATVQVQPATATRSGSITVKIPEHYRGSRYQGAAKPRTLYLADGRRTTPILGTLTVRTGSRFSAFSSATYRGTIPAGTAVGIKDLARALGPLHVNASSLKIVKSTKPRR